MKPSETSWNQLNPAKTTSNHPETIWNHLKPAILKYLLLQISYSHIEFVLMLQTKVFFGQIWSRKLNCETKFAQKVIRKFSKLSEIWDKGTLLYADYNFNVYFFKMFVIHIFWDYFGPEILCSPN